MEVYVDADACPVTAIVERVAKQYSIPVHLVCDVNHCLYSDYSEIIMVDKGADSADLAIINRCKRYDIVVTQDYGVAALALSKGAYAIHQSGMLYTEDNIDRLLQSRYAAAQARRRSSKTHLKGAARRTKEDDIEFEFNFRKLIERDYNDKGEEEPQLL
jgi:hypothetical protein